MIRRASRELEVEKIREFNSEHRELISDFLESHQVLAATRSILARIPEYLASVPTAWIYNARASSGKLVAFDIAEFGAKHYAFYMFNFRSRQGTVPGASDLLLHTLIKEASQKDKSFVNLGLGLNEAVAFFKKKWGGQPFLRHELVFFGPGRPSFWETIWQGLSRS